MATKKQQKAKQAAAKLAKELQIEIDHVSRCYTQNGIHPAQNPNGAVNRNVVRTNKDQRLVAVMCPYKDCGQEFGLKKKGDLGSYNIGGYSRHLEEAHNFHRPRPVEVWGF